MAGGGCGTGSGVPLSERVRTGGLPGPPPAPLVSSGYPGRHCWVTVPVDGSPPQPRAALLLEWRRSERGRWEGRVVYAAELRPGQMAAVTEWVPATLLTTQPTGSA